jgi:hypothetical protein
MTVFMSLVAFDDAISQTSGTRANGGKTSAEVLKEDALPNDFLGHADLRAVTLFDIANLECAVKDLEDNKIPYAETLARQLTQDKDQIKELESKKLDSSTQSQLAFLRTG